MKRLGVKKVGHDQFEVYFDYLTFIANAIITIYKPI